MNAYAREQLLRLQQVCHGAADEIHELAVAGAPHGQILALYPFEFTAYAAYLSQRLAREADELVTIPGAKPLPILRLKFSDMRAGWYAYEQSAAHAQHRAQLRAIDGANSALLPDLYDALWTLSNWERAVEQVGQKNADRLAMVHYVAGWCRWFLPENYFSNWALGTGR